MLNKTQIHWSEVPYLTVILKRLKQIWNILIENRTYSLSPTQTHQEWKSKQVRDFSHEFVSGALVKDLLSILIIGDPLIRAELLWHLVADPEIDTFLTLSLHYPPAESI